MPPSYFHGTISRDDAVKRLQDVPSDGAFLVRQGANKGQWEQYTISFKSHEVMKHVKVEHTARGYILEQEFATVWELIDAQVEKTTLAGISGDVVEVALKVPVADATVPTAVGRSIVIVGLSGPAAAQEGAMPVREAATGGRTVCMFADGGGLTPKFVGNFMRVVADGADFPAELTTGLTANTGYMPDYNVSGDGEAGGINGVYRYEGGKLMKKLKAFDTAEAVSLSSICKDYPSFDQFVFLGYTAGDSLSMTLSAEPAAAPAAAAEGDAATDSAEPAAAPATVAEGDASAEPAPAAVAEGDASAEPAPEADASAEPAPEGDASAEPAPAAAAEGDAAADSAEPAAAAEGDAASEGDAAPTAE